MRVRTSSAVLWRPWLATRSTTFLTSAGLRIAFSDEVLAAAAAADRGRLGAGADQRVAGAHEDGAGPHDGLRHLDDPHLAPAHAPPAARRSPSWSPRPSPRRAAVRRYFATHARRGRCVYRPVWSCRDTGASMCGIVGWLSTSSGARLSTARRSRACGTRWCTAVPTAPASGWPPGARSALAFRRLAIVDLSTTANQPMTNEDGTRPGGLQRRDLQPPGAAQGARGEGPPLQDRPLRHRGDRPRLRGVGRRRRRAHPRDVRDRDLGRRRAPAVPGARPRRDQAALLHAGRAPASCSPPRSRRCSRTREVDGRRRAALRLPLPLVPDDARSAHDVPRRLQDARRLPGVREAGRVDEGRGLLGRAARPRRRPRTSCAS